MIMGTKLQPRWPKSHEAHIRFELYERNSWRRRRRCGSPQCTQPKFPREKTPRARARKTEKVRECRQGALVETLATHVNGRELAPEVNASPGRWS